MKRLLLPLLAAFALPTAVKAETYWLVLIMGYSRCALEKIEMKSMEQCKEEGAKFETKKTIDRRYICLIGK